MYYSTDARVTPRDVRSLPERGTQPSRNKVWLRTKPDKKTLIPNFWYPGAHRRGGRRCGGERAGMMEGVDSDGAKVQRAGSQDIGEGERAETMKPRDLPPPPPPPPPRLPRPTSRSSSSRRTARWKSFLLRNQCMEEDQLSVPNVFQQIPLPTDLEGRQVFDKSYNAGGGKKRLSPSSSDLELLLQQVRENKYKAAVMDVGWMKKWLAAVMDVGRRKKWVAAVMAIFTVLMIFMLAIPRDKDYHEFRRLFLGILNTLNVVSTIFFFVGLAGLILCHYKNYFRLCSQGGHWSWTLFFAGVIAVGFGSSCYHLNPKNATLFWDTLPMMFAFTSSVAILIIERVEHLCAAMVPVFLILMLAERAWPVELERVQTESRMICLWVRRSCLCVPRIQRPDFTLITNLPRQLLSSMAYYVDHIAHKVAAIMYEISILLWEFCARYVLARSVNQANTFEERVMPHRGQQLMPRIRGLWGMDIYKNKVHEFLERSDESFFGIWGRSGVGKTRLLSLISDCYGDSFSHLFALGGGSVRDMQYNLNIFLKLDWERMSLLEEHHRAKIIAEYLEHHSFLLLLDNVQDGLVDLAAIGLPMPLKRRQKVVLASRSQVVCGRMGCTMSNIVEMKCLGDEDAWNLFKYNLGVEFTDADTKIHEIAKQMVSECGGLPRAIRSIGVGVAGATCSGKDLDDWLYAYDRIKAKNLPPERMDEIVSVLV